jgi:hypothetical protein
MHGVFGDMFRGPFELIQKACARFRHDSSPI